MYYSTVAPPRQDGAGLDQDEPQVTRPIRSKETLAACTAKLTEFVRGLVVSSYLTEVEKR